MGHGCDCSHCPGCGDVADEPKKKTGGTVIEPDDAEVIEEVDLGDDDLGDDEEDEEV